MTTAQNHLTHSFYIKFYPALLSFTCSERATLIAGKLEYWFSKPQYEGGFYKFIEPCADPLYREGDSWSEELGVSRKLFAKAFDIIGVRYSSKSSYLKAEDKFQGKLYASYHDRQTNRTYFVRNHEFTSQLLESLNASYSAAKQKIKKSVKNTFKRFSPEERSLEKSTLNKTSPLESVSPKEPTPVSTPFNVSEGRSWNGDLGRSCVRESFFIQRETSSLETEIQNSLSPTLPDSQIREETEEMIKIWKEEIGELGIPEVSSRLLQRLQKVFQEVFDQSIESWKKYCEMISSSKFLMGEAQNKFFKKAWITWAINPENIERIKGGNFRLGDRKTNHDKKMEAINREIINLEYKKNQIESKISNIKSDERERRKNIVQEKIKNLSGQEEEKLKQEFKAFLERENNSMTEEFRKLRWRGMFISSYFDGFVEEKLYTDLFDEMEEVNDEKIIQSSGLLELLDEVGYELSLMRQRKRTLESSILESLTPESYSSETLRYFGSYTRSIHPSMTSHSSLGGGCSGKCAMGLEVI